MCVVGRPKPPPAPKPLPPPPPLPPAPPPPPPPPPPPAPAAPIQDPGDTRSRSVSSSDTRRSKLARRGKRNLSIGINTGGD